MQRRPLHERYAVFRSSQLALAVAVFLFPYTASAQKPDLKYRWVYITSNFLVDANAVKVEALMRRAKAAGYNGVAIGDSKFSFLQRMPKSYFDNVATVAKTAKDVGLELYPMLANPGWANDLLANDPNLAEGMPVKNALFVAKGGRADPVEEPKTGFQNGDFEAVQGEKMSGWSWQDAPGKATVADSQAVHGGGYSLRMDNPSANNPESGNCRIVQGVVLAPFRQYHISAWIKTDGFTNLGETRIAVLAPDGRSLTFNSLDLKPTQDWTRVDVVFNSQKYAAANIYLGVWGGGKGKLWWDDVKLEEVGFLNVIRRKGCPLTVHGEDGTIYEEGRDYEPVKDPRMGTVPWPGGYEVWHDSPPLTLTPNSRIKEGQRLRVSYFHNVIVYDGSVACCMSDPRVIDLIGDSARRLHEVLSPAGFFLSYDEIRNANWCETCAARNMTPGQILADHLRKCVAMVRKIDPRATLCVWSDMFDPTHNAHDQYYLANGSFAGSWEGLPPDLIVVNWNSGAQARESMEFFSKRGNRQILAGYYDAPPDRIKDWLKKAEGVKGVAGVMYTTWQDNFSDLEAFAKAAWGG